MKSMDYILKHSFENDLPDPLGFVGTVMLQWEPIQCQQHMWVTGAGTTPKSSLPNSLETSKFSLVLYPHSKGILQFILARELSWVFFYNVTKLVNKAVTEEVREKQNNYKF